VELPAGISNVGTILLMGQPIGWLVPAFNQPIPFLQIDPNFSVHSSSYGQKLLNAIDRSREIRVIFNPSDYSFEQTAQRVAEGGYSVTPADCDPLAASMGGRPFNFSYCRLTYCVCSYCSSRNCTFTASINSLNEILRLRRSTDASE